MSRNFAPVIWSLDREEDLLQLRQQFVSAKRQLLRLTVEAGAALGGRGPSSSSSSSSSQSQPRFFFSHFVIRPSPEHEGVTGRCGPPRPRGFLQVEEPRDLPLHPGSRCGGWRSGRGSERPVQSAGGPGPGWGSTRPTLERQQQPVRPSEAAPSPGLQLQNLLAGLSLVSPH